jgi:hypothetical protein
MCKHKFKMLYCLSGISPVLKVTTMDVITFCYFQVFMHSTSDVYTSSHESKKKWVVDVEYGDSWTVLFNVSYF